MLFLLNRLLQFYDTNAANAKVSSQSPEKKKTKNTEKNVERKGSVRIPPSTVAV
jgi:hypothetical protein